MPYKAHEKFVEEAKEKQNLFTKNEALKATLSAPSPYKRNMKINLDGIKLAFNRINEINNADKIKDENER